MYVRATIKLRNDAMIRARKKLGWSQADLAREAGISTQVVCALESFDFSTKERPFQAQKVADALCIPVWNILPKSLHGTRIESTRVSVGEVDDRRLIEAMGSRALLPAADSGLIQRESTEELHKHTKRLSARVRQVLEMRYGLDGNGPRTLEEIGLATQRSRERVRQILNKGEAQLRDLFEGKEVTDDDSLPD